MNYYNKIINVLLLNIWFWLEYYEILYKYYIIIWDEYCIIVEKLFLLYIYIFIFYEVYIINIFNIIVIL